MAQRPISPPSQTSRSPLRTPNRSRSSSASSMVSRSDAMQSLLVREVVVTAMPDGTTPDLAALANKQVPSADSKPFAFVVGQLHGEQVGCDAEPFGTRGSRHGHARWHNARSRRPRKQ